jgi:large subunit ribosomal protein L22
MGHAANKRREAPNEAKAMTKYLASSPRKLNLVAQMIRGKTAGKALIDLDFCERRMAREVKKTLQAAVANAENNHNLDVDRLYIAEAVVGKSVMMRRFRARARGRVGPVEKFFSRITIIVREREA